MMKGLLVLKKKGQKLFFTIYGLGGHLAHVTEAIFLNHVPFQSN